MIIENGIVPADKVAKDADFDEYELKEACETLAKAEEIKANDRLMRALQPMLEKKQKAYASLSDLRGLYYKKKKEEEDFERNKVAKSNEGEA